MTNVQTLRELRTLTISLLSRLDDEIARARAETPPRPIVHVSPLEVPATKTTTARPMIAAMTAVQAVKAVLARGPLTIAEMYQAMATAGNTTKKSTLGVVVSKMAMDGEIRRVARGEYALPEAAA